MGLQENYRNLNWSRDRAKLCSYYTIQTGYTDSIFCRATIWQGLSTADWFFATAFYGHGFVAKQKAILNQHKDWKAIIIYLDPEEC